jgi:hypothetical protein
MKTDRGFPDTAASILVATLLPAPTAHTAASKGDGACDFVPAGLLQETVAAGLWRLGLPFFVGEATLLVLAAAAAVVGLLPLLLPWAGLCLLLLLEGLLLELQGGRNVV